VEIIDKLKQRFHKRKKKPSYILPNSWTKKDPKQATLTPTPKKKALSRPKLSWNILPKHVISGRVPHLLFLERLYAGFVLLIDGVLTSLVLSTGAGSILGLLTFLNTLLAISYLHKTSKMKE